MDYGMFYCFLHNSSYTRGFMWATTIQPRSEMIHRELLDLGVVVDYPSGAFDVEVTGGTKYPDILGCGSYPFLVVSERVILAWHEAGIRCFHTFPVGITGAYPRRLSAITPPLYFRVEIDGQCEIDVAVSGNAIVYHIPEYQYLQVKDPIMSGFRMVPGSWDGNALFRDFSRFPRVTFCTQTVLEIAHEYRLTNFRFEPMAGPFDLTSKGIDYLRRKPVRAV